MTKSNLTALNVIGGGQGRIHDSSLPESITLASERGSVSSFRHRREKKEIVVSLIDDSSLTRECLSLGLSAYDKNIIVNGIANPGEMCKSNKSATFTDLIIYNICRTSIFDAAVASDIQELTSGSVNAPVILLSSNAESEVILAGLRMGVHGFITPTLGLEVTLEAIRLVAAGEMFIPLASLNTLIPYLNLTEKPSPLTDSPVPKELHHAVPLTPREMLVFDCLKKGQTNKVIAYELGLCENTVKAHVRNLLRKLGATNRTHAVYLAKPRLGA